MKIEMLEQMFASYLKNCEGCLITQTNWSVSKLLFDKEKINCIKEVELIMNEIKSTLPNLNVFKNSTSEQFITQCEIDVVGLKIENGNKTVFLYDTAFHENSLNYKDTPATVIKKLIRAFIVGDVFFRGFEIKVGFISPKCGKSNEKIITDYLCQIIPILSKYNSSIKIDLFLNSQCDDIINDLLSQIDNISDDNDLFIRSIKLFNLTNKNKMNLQVAPTTLVTTIKYSNKARVMEIMEYLIKNGKINSIMLDNLMDKTYAKNEFNLPSFPFLIESSFINPDNQYRYYPTVFNICGKLFRVCSQWIPERMRLLELWFNKIK